VATKFDQLRATLCMSFLRRVQPLPLAMLPLPTRRTQRLLSPVSAGSRQDLQKRTSESLLANPFIRTATKEPGIQVPAFMRMASLVLYPILTGPCGNKSIAFCLMMISLDTVGPSFRSVFLTNHSMRTYLETQTWASCTSPRIATSR
jgi:hypothetical protein